jgi:hypothetical protein
MVMVMVTAGIVHGIVITTVVVPFGGSGSGNITVKEIQWDPEQTLQCGQSSCNSSCQFFQRKCFASVTTITTSAACAACATACTVEKCHIGGMKEQTPNTSIGEPQSCLHGIND